MNNREFKFDSLSNRIIGVAIEIHKKLGPGFLENVYHNALKKMLSIYQINYETEKGIKIYLIDIEIGYHRLDLVVEIKIVVELKAVEEISKVHIAQIISYMKALHLKIGLILNFSKTVLEIRRFDLNEYFAKRN